MSDNDAFLAVSAGVYQVMLPLTFASVPAISEQGSDLIAAAADTLVFDLQRVPAIDSAGLALLVDWLARARVRECKLSYVQPPQTLLSLAKLSDVERLFSDS